MINIAIAEDNIIALSALEEKLSPYTDIHIVHRAKDGQELLAILEQNSDVGVVLMDIEMPVMNGIDATAFIKQQYPAIKIVMVTVYDDDESIFNAIRAGADSYILKETKSEKVYETITDTLSGGAVMSPSIAVKALSVLKRVSLPKPEAEGIILSERETEILEQLSKGFSNKIISANLFISPFTVKRHVENIYQKLRAHNRVELVEKARQKGMI